MVLGVEQPRRPLRRDRQGRQALHDLGPEQPEAPLREAVENFLVDILLLGAGAVAR